METDLILRPDPLDNALTIVPNTDMEVLMLGRIYQKANPDCVNLKVDEYENLSYLYITTTEIIRLASL